MERKRLLIIDFNNLLYAHYYSKPLINTKGQSVHAIKGFLYRLKNLRDMFDPDYILIARDVSRRKTFRRELYPGYKGTRGTTPDDLIFQSKSTLQILDLMGYPIIGHERYEADDIMGMASKLGSDLDMEVIIVSGDKDLYQLVNDNVSIWSFRLNELVTPQYLSEVYGLTPNQWIDLKILQGDKSDNIPGIPGIGQKTALQLMKGFGSISEIYSNINKLSESFQNKLKLGKDQLQLSRILVTILTDYNILSMSENDFKRKEIFKNEVYNVIAELEIPSLFNVIKYELLPIGRKNPTNP